MISINDIYDYFENNHSCKIKTMKEISKDKHNYLTDSIQYAYHFDKIAEDDFRSCDALFVSKSKNCIYFIEFKNQSCVNEKGDPTSVFNVDLRLKAVESLNILYSRLKENKLLNNRCDMCKIKRKLIVVYSESKTNHKIDKIHRSRAFSIAGKKFQVQDYQDYLYDNVVVIPNTKFEDYNLV